MSDDWFTQPGKTGVVTITHREGNWFMTYPETESKTKCILQGDFSGSAGCTTQQLEITISKFMHAAGQGPNYLFAVPRAEDGSSESAKPNSEIDSSTAKTKKSTSTNSNDRPTNKNNEGLEKRSLPELSGSGDYVTVEAIVDDVFWIKKDEPNVPDIIGVLRDEDSGEKRMFVVNEGVKHPYLEEGRKFVFRNVKDHLYERKNKVQCKITRHTNFTDKGLTKEDSKTESKSSKEKSSSEKSLQQIARAMLGGEELKMKQQGRDSSIGKAKKKARRQQRDPAIDPKLNKSR